jgi:hypothetical protein
MRFSLLDTCSFQISIADKCVASAKSRDQALASLTCSVGFVSPSWPPKEAQLSKIVELDAKTVTQRHRGTKTLGTNNPRAVRGLKFQKR